MYSWEILSSKSSKKCLLKVPQKDQHEHDETMNKKMIKNNIHFI